MPWLYTVQATTAWLENIEQKWPDNQGRDTIRSQCVHALVEQYTVKFQWISTERGYTPANLHYSITESKVYYTLHNNSFSSSALSDGLFLSVCGEVGPGVRFQAYTVVYARQGMIGLNMRTSILHNHWLYCIVYTWLMLYTYPTQLL